MTTSLGLQMSPLFFDTVFNMNKFLIHESRDPQRIRQVCVCVVCAVCVCMY